MTKDRHWRTSYVCVLVCGPLPLKIGRNRPSSKLDIHVPDFECRVLR